MQRALVVGMLVLVASFAVLLVGAPRVEAQVPSITILSPKVATVSSLGFQMQVGVADFILDQANYGGTNIAGHGHIHYTVNGTLVGPTWLTVFNFGALPLGPSTIRAELRNNDHSPLSPAAFQEIYVTAIPPSIAIVTPKVTSVSSLGFQMQVVVNGFVLDEPNYGGTNVPGQGHIHYTVDGALVGPTTSTVWNFGAMTVGTHAIRAELRNNNHSPLVPRVFQEINFTTANPSIAIVSPKVGTVPTLGVRVEVVVGGFILDEANYGGTNIAGQGHIHYLVDGNLASPTSATTVSLGPLAAGAHTIRAELRNNNHAPLSPAVFQEITVTAAGPSIAIVSPEVTVVSTLGFRIEVAVAGFFLDQPNYGGTNVPGQGHIHYIVDGSLASATAGTSAHLGPLTAGTHVIRTELRNNDHSPLSPAVFQEITVTAAAPSVAATLSSTTIQTGQAVVVSWTVAGFVLDSVAFGGTSEAGRGHVHISVDGGSPSMSTGTALTISDLAVGSHTIVVSLANNDHSPLSPAVQSQVTVQVSGAPPAPAATVEANVFYGTLIGLIVVIVALAAVAMRRRGGGGGPMEKTE